jgi:hypothetical protein
MHCWIPRWQLWCFFTPCGNYSTDCDWLRASSPSPNADFAPTFVWLGVTFETRWNHELRHKRAHRLRWALYSPMARRTGSPFSTPREEEGRDTITEQLMTLAPRRGSLRSSDLASTHLHF